MHEGGNICCASKGEETECKLLTLVSIFQQFCPHIFLLLITDILCINVSSVKCFYLLHREEDIKCHTFNGNTE